MKNRLPPEKFGKAAVVKHGAYMFEESAIEGFRNPIVLGGIMRGESSLHSFGFEMVGELCAEVLAPAVTAETLDLRAVLGVSPSFEFDIGVEGVILPMKKFDMRPAGTVIGERGVIFPMMDGFGGSWSPDVGVNLVPKLLGQRFLPFLPHPLPRCLRKLTRLAGPNLFPIILQLHPNNSFILHELPHSI